MIVLVRHGETEGNAKRVMQVPEVPLSAAGMRQAELLAQRLAQLELSAIVCSDLRRAHMTAEAIAAGTRLPIELQPLLQERNFGELRGVPYAQLGSDPFAADYVPPGGESWEAFHARIARAFSWIVARRRSERGCLVVVSHGLVCSAIVQRHLRVADASGVPLRFDNTSVTLFEAEAPHHARLINCSLHLGERPSAGAPA
jgi:probable phosphoglycerate mutase